MKVVNNSTHTKNGMSFTSSVKLKRYTKENEQSAHLIIFFLNL